VTSWAKHLLTAKKDLNENPERKKKKQFPRPISGFAFFCFFTFGEMHETRNLSSAIYLVAAAA
jgi:hypothetical protein